MKSVVYCLYDYEESEPEHMICTLDRHKLCDMLLHGTFNNDRVDEDHAAYKARCIETLKELLSKSDETLLGDAQTSYHKLGYGWGSIHLSVSRLA